jgi:transposase
MKKTITAQDKAKIAIEALKETDTIASIASRYDAHPIQVGIWKKTAKERLHTIFDSTHNEQKQLQEMAKQIDELHRLLGTRDEEIAWLKKKSAT